MSSIENLLPISELSIKGGSERDSDKIDFKTQMISKINTKLEEFSSKQKKCTDEIQMKLKEIQVLKDNNLVLSGAVAAMKSIKSEFE